IHAPKQTVENGLAARKSDSARESLAAGLTIEQAATVAEFDDDPEHVTDLLTAAQRGQVDHVASKRRRDRERALAVAAGIERLTGEDVIVLDETPWDYSYDGRGPVAPLDALGVDETEHATCPGHAAVVTATWDGESRTQYLCTDWRANDHENH